MASRVVAVDIGSYSIQAVLAELGDDGRVAVIERIRDEARLGMHRELPPKAIARAERTLRLAADLAARHDAPLRAVATAGLRSAANSALLVDSVRADCGIAIEIIEGVTEARLVFLGAHNALQSGTQPLVICDMGGGSTEFAWFDGDSSLAVASLPIGTLKLTDRFVQDGELDRSACREHTRAAVHSIRHQPNEPDALTVSSGTAAAVFRLAKSIDDPDGPAPTTGATLSLDEFRRAANVAAAMRPKELVRVSGISTSRAEVLAAGAIALAEIVTELGFSAIVLSRAGIREGLVVDTLAPPATLDVRAITASPV